MGWRLELLQGSVSPGLLPPSYLHTASIQRLDVGVSLGARLYILSEATSVSQPITGCIARQEVKVLSY